MTLNQIVKKKSSVPSYLSTGPSKDVTSSAAAIEIIIEPSEYVIKEHKRLQDAIEAGDLSQIVARYPIRESPALDRIASKLGFQNRAKYEAAVRALLTEDDDALEFVRSLFGTLASDIDIS